MLPWLLWSALAIAAAVTMVRALGRWSDYQGYIDCGEAALAGTYDPKPGDNYYVWPPFYSLLAIPLALLARAGEVWPRAVWAGINLALAAYVVRLWVGSIVPREKWPLLMPVVVAATLSFLSSTIGYHQINLVILSLLLSGAFLIGRDKEFKGGALVGLAAALKVWPAFLLPYFLLRRQWRAVAAAIAVGAASLAAPIVLYGPSRTVELTLRFLRAGGPTSGGSHEGRNQALNGVITRLFSETNDPQRLPFLPIFSISTASAARVSLILGALLFGWLTWRIARRPNPQPLIDLAVLAPASQWLVSPLLWRHYLISLIGAVALVAGAHPRAPRGLTALAVVASGLIFLQEPGLAGFEVSRWALVGNAGFLMTGCTIAAAVWAREISRRSGSARVDSGRGPGD